MERRGGLLPGLAGHARAFGVVEPLRCRVAGWVVRPRVVLGMLMGGYVVVFATLTWRQHAAYGTFGFDMGIHDQGIWLTSRLRDPFVTVRGLNYFGHHLNVVTVAFVPFYWLGAGPQFLYLAQTVALAAGAVPVWLLARDRLGSGWLALVPAAALLLHPAVEWINWWHFHPDALAVTPLLFAWWLATRRSWRWFAVAVAFGLAAKEDAALAVGMIGVVLALRGERRAGALAAAAGFGWFVLATSALMPWFAGSEPFYAQDFFPQFGDSPGSVIWGIVTSPGEVLSLLFEESRRTYYMKLLGPLALLPLVAPAVLLIGAPQTAANALSALPGTSDIRFHYSSVLVAALLLAAVEGLGRLWRWKRAVGMSAVAILGAASLVANVAWSPSPLGREFDSGIWAERQPRHDTFDRAVAAVPAGAGVSASYSIISHLTHREHAYEWPNPWVVGNWGVRSSAPPDPENVDWLVLDLTLDQEPDLVARLLGREFEPVLERDGVLVARRFRSGLRRQPPSGGAALSDRA